MDKKAGAPLFCWNEQQQRKNNVWSYDTPSDTADLPVKQPKGSLREKMLQRALDKHAYLEGYMHKQAIDYIELLPAATGAIGLTAGGTMASKFAQKHMKNKVLASVIGSLLGGSVGGMAGMVAGSGLLKLLHEPKPDPKA